MRKIKKIYCKRLDKHSKPSQEEILMINHPLDLGFVYSMSHADTILNLEEKKLNFEE